MAGKPKETLGFLMDEVLYILDENAKITYISPNIKASKSTHLTNCKNIGKMGLEDMLGVEK